MRSLVLLDELGAGTDPDEGGALGYAILEELYRRRIPTIATTHLGRLKEFAHEHRQATNGAMAFDPRSLEPLYRLEVGVPGASNALHIAGAVGLARDVVARARTLLGTADRRVEEMIDSLQLTRLAAEEERRRGEAIARRLQDGEQELADAQRDVELQREWLRSEAEHFVDEELKAARAALQAPLREFLNAPRPYGDKARVLLEALESILHGSSLGRRRLQFVDRLRKGARVYVPHYRRSCEVLKVDRARRKILVLIGDLRVEVAYQDISWLHPLDDLV
jgi:DNA mismatch repair protein MutS2